MFSFELTRIGTIKKGPFALLANTYTTRLSPYGRLNVTHAKESKSSHPATRISEESETLRKAIKESAFTVLLTEHGKVFDSVSFAKQLTRWSQQESRPIQFLLAGPHGIEDDLLHSVDATLSLSPMTFPHDLAHAVLLEQLYRACTILHGKTYHY